MARLLAVAQTERDPKGASVSRRFSWDAEGLLGRLRNELSSHVRQRLSHAAERSGMDVLISLS